MKRNAFFFLSALAFVATALIGCTEPITPGLETDEEDSGKTEEVELKPLTLSVPVTDNWVWESKPAITITAQNANGVAMEADVKVSIMTDKGEEVEVVQFKD